MNEEKETIEELTEDLEDALSQCAMDHICRLIRDGKLNEAKEVLLREEGHWLSSEDASRIVQAWDEEFGRRPIDDQTEELIHAFRQNRAKKEDYDRDTLFAMFERLCAIGHLPKYDHNEWRKWVDENGNPK